MTERSKNQDRCRHHDATPGGAADNSARTALHDSFPASDPIATTAMVGIRAVDLAGAMKPQAKIGGMAMVLASLRDQEAARHAVEHLVRKVPLDRRRFAIRNRRNGRVTLEISASPADVDRIAEMLYRHGRNSGRDIPSG